MHNTSAAPRQPHMKKVSSFSTNSSTVSFMSNSSANTTTNNTITKVMSTVLMVRILFSAFTWVSAARERWDLKCLPCDETNEKGEPKTQKDRQAQCHCCLGVLTARMTPTAQAGWKSWYVSVPIVTFNARRIATQTSTDSHVCAPSIAPEPGRCTPTVE